MINSGLVTHPSVDLTTNGNVVSLGVIKHLRESIKVLGSACVNADFVFVPSPEHFDWPGWSDFFDAHDLWGKIVCYDFSDSPAIDTELAGKVRLYVKRTFTLEHKALPYDIFHVPYAALYEYNYDWGKPDRTIDIAYLMDPNPDSPFEQSRHEVRQAFHKWEVGDLSQFFIWLGQSKENGRRAIFDKDDFYNPFASYMRMLRKIRCIVHVEPDHPGGDSRMWESLLSGALVLCKAPVAMAAGVKETDHVISFHGASGLLVYLKQLDDLMDRQEVKNTIWRSKDLVMYNHMPHNRVHSILNKLLPGIQHPDMGGCQAFWQQRDFRL